MVTRRIARRDLLARTGSIVAGVAAAGLLAACGGGVSGSASGGQTATASVAGVPSGPTASATASQAPKTTASQAASASASSAAATTSAAAQAPASAGTGPVFWQWGPTYNNGFATITKNFNASHKVQVDTPPAPSDYWTKMVTVLAAGNPPDAFLMNNVSFKIYAHNKTVADLSSYLQTDKTASANAAGMNPALTDWYKFQGKVMGTPWDYSAGVVTYHTDLLKAAGLDVPSSMGKQWDWNALRNYATKQTQKQGADTTRAGFYVGVGLENGYYTFCVANGGSFFNDALDQCTIASPEAISGLEVAVTMVRDGIATTGGTKFWNDENTKYSKTNAGTYASAFIASELAMGFGGDWVNNWYIQGKLQQWDETIFPYSPTTGKTANTANLRGVCMTAASKKKDDTWTWMAYLMSPEVQNQIPTLINEVPALQTSAATYALDPAKAGPPDGRKYLKAELDATVPLPASEWISWNDIVKYAYGKPMTDVFVGALSPSDGMKQMQDAINGIIAGNKGKTTISPT